ncbi:MAG TPA: PorP/SprF family type IX secretion system membrane protein [Bacteroidia bacterium]|nr:PorP/SprF family type IX secretion system membrane protein [Bacteroidia bacterium]
MKKILLPFTVVLFGVVSGQDLHYSLYTMAPLNVNPALTGNFNGDLRVINNFRQQWSTISTAYMTYSLGIDMPLERKDKRKPSPDFFAVGYNMNMDRTGINAIRNYQFNGTFSYNKSFDGLGATFVSLGGVFGFTQRSINIQSASWDSQWNGIAYDGALSTGETLLTDDTYFYLDGGIGAAFTSTKYERIKFSGGMSALHLNRPEVCFLGGTDWLQIRYSAHLNTQIRIGTDTETWIYPNAMFVSQGPARMLNVGIAVKNRLTERSIYTNYATEKSITIGTMYRLEDAVSAYIRLDIGPIGAAFNYDFNISKLTVVSKGKGAMEFMLIYTGLYKDKNTRMSKPVFL